ncbi:MAG: hypothetical protein U1D41_14615 [Nitrosomonas sp.]|uniref:hypothetical protein n=1 Tax=Nitrosomonas sp. TaxID=42353 RepID=UPI00277877AA|nr:hypothetical protein [Nitrosomonas sp.]MDP3609456.1 hypothetical protein [Methylophilus sp.]MDZ4107360.1 hypothetical protein [Nitrosomonas sp.]
MKNPYPYMYELYQLIHDNYPNDVYFTEADRHKEDFEDYWKIYESAFQIMDKVSWENLKQEALEKSCCEQVGRKKSQFFSILNQAVAYQYLRECGYIVVPEKVSNNSCSGKATRENCCLLICMLR